MNSPLLPFRGEPDTFLRECVQIIGGYLLEAIMPTSDRLLHDVLLALTSNARLDASVLKTHPLGKTLLAASAEQQTEFVAAAAEWLRGPRSERFHNAAYQLTTILEVVLRRKLPLDEPELIALLEIGGNFPLGWHIETQLPKLLERYLAKHPRTPALDAAVDRCIAELTDYSYGSNRRRRLAQLRQLRNGNVLINPLIPTDPWAAAAITHIAALEDGQRQGWLALLNTASSASGTPSVKWQQAGQQQIAALGVDEFCGSLCAWLTLINQPAPDTSHHPGSRTHPLLLAEQNADILRGLVWLCAPILDINLARALGALAFAMYRRVPQVGARCPRVGNAAILVLGQQADAASLAQLAVLKARLKQPAARRVINQTLDRAAQRAKLSAEQFEELVVPTYEMTEVGLRREQLGEVHAELVIGGPRQVVTRWHSSAGQRLATVPKATRAAYPEQYAALKASVADIKQMLVAQRQRIEQLYLARRSWCFAEWQSRYLNHPLVGALARRLIWVFGDGEQQTSGIWHAGQICGFDDQPIGWLGDATAVQLWHPIDAPVSTTLAWREWLAAHAITQPFKQAYREVYLLTDAEERTNHYSNRFAAHIVRQHLFSALCTARGWRHQLQLMFDHCHAAPHRLLPAWQLRAEYWVEPLGNNYHEHTNHNGTYTHLSTDQIRFFRLDSPPAVVHPAGGGYSLGWDQTATVALPLATIPPIVFSEIMRDADLFVGVASIGNDPTWTDGRRERPEFQYWQNFAFGSLSENAKTRREVLRQIVPRLKIADRCEVTDRFLQVQGTRRSYKIHLGSGNILMSPNDQYLCIVPGRGAALNEHGAFLPFEGDALLSIILSKAVLLANDQRITDPTILSQLDHQ